jgi:hypothetical protein
MPDSTGIRRKTHGIDGRNGPSSVAPDDRHQDRKQEGSMAKGQKRSTREAKKPKAEKKPAAAAASPFTREPTKKSPPPRGNG